MRWPALLLLAVLFLPRPLIAADDVVVIDDFDGGLAPGWGVKSFSGYNDYRVVMDGPNHVMLAESNGTASSLYYRKTIDLKKHPVLRWRWKIEATVPGGDVRHKESDDYPARIYIVFPHWLFTRTRSINYIWANRLPQGDIVANPHTENSQMIAVESGDDKAGTWVTESRNVYEDYKAVFGEEPGMVGVIAIMTDSDSTGTSARAWYDDIRFTAE